MLSMEDAHALAMDLSNAYIWTSITNYMQIVEFPTEYLQRASLIDQYVALHAEESLQTPATVQA